MSRAERCLAWFLRIEAMMLMCALPAVVMPTEWMATIHAAVGLGELPRTPLVEYLTRSLSLVYAGWGPILIALSWDVKRHLPVLWVFSWMSLAFVPAIVILDVVAAMPLGWIVWEGVSVLVIATVGVMLVWRVAREGS